MFDFLSGVSQDQIWGFVLILVGIVVFIWGLRHLWGANDGSKRMWIIRIGAAIWNRVIGGALVLIGLICLYAGSQLMMATRTISS